MNFLICFRKFLVGYFKIKNGVLNILVGKFNLKVWILNFKFNIFIYNLIKVKVVC